MRNIYEYRLSELRVTVVAHQPIEQAQRAGHARQHDHQPQPPHSASPPAACAAT